MTDEPKQGGGTTGHLLIREFTGPEEVLREVANVENDRLFVPLEGMGHWDTGIDTHLLIVLGPDADPIELVGTVLHVDAEGIAVVIGADAKKAFLDAVEGMGVDLHRGAGEAGDDTMVDELTGPNDGGPQRVESLAPAEVGADGVAVLRRRLEAEDLAAEYETNLRLGRAFIRTAHHPDILAAVRLVYEILDDGRTFTLTGQVVFHRVAGVGIQLDAMSAAQNIAFQRLLSTWI